MEEKKKLDLTKFLGGSFKSAQSPKKPSTPEPKSKSSNIFELPSEMSLDVDEFFKQDINAFQPLPEMKNRHTTKEIAINGITYLTLNKIKRENKEADIENIRETLVKTEQDLGEYLKDFNTSDILKTASDNEELKGLNMVCKAGAIVEFAKNEGLESIYEMSTPEFIKSQEKHLSSDEIFELGNKIEYDIKSKAIKRKIKDYGAGKKMYECATIVGDTIRDIAKKRK